MSGTWILFTSGQAVEIVVSRNQPARVGGNPADVYMITDCHSSFQESAQRAAAVFYRWAETSGRKPEPFAAGIDLAGLSKGDALTGESGGVALAVALAKLLMGHDPGPVAATGVITARNGQIEAIKGLATKLEGAAKTLPVGGWIFYPQANLDQEADPTALSQQIEDLRQQGYRLHAVSTVAEVLSELFCAQSSCSKPDSLPIEKTPKKRLVWLLMAVLFGAALWGTLAARDKQAKTSDAATPSVSSSVSADLSRESVGNLSPVIKTKSSINAEAAPSVDSQKPAAWVTGSSRLEKTLAQQVETILRRVPGLSPESLPAQLQILGVTEEMLADGMLTTISVQVAESHFLHLKQIIDLHSFDLTLSQSGLIEKALPQLATKLGEHWLAMLGPDIDNHVSMEKQTDLKKSGFD